jgi:16S rRNA processing protein RimM
VTGRDQELLAIGQIVKAFGIRGDVIVQSLAEDRNRFRRLRTALMGKTATSVREVRIERTQSGPRGVRLKIAGVDDRTAAEQLKSQYLFVDVQHRAPLPRGRYYVHEVIGLSVVDEDDTVLGVIRDVLKLPAHDVYVVERHGQEFMIPAVKEFVKRIDPANGTIRVRLIEGLLET